MADTLLPKIIYLSSSQIAECKFHSDSLTLKKVGSGQLHYPTFQATPRDGLMNYLASHGTILMVTMMSQKCACESIHVS